MTEDVRFGGIDRLFGVGALGRLQAAHVAVMGIGGVGSWTVEALARSGVGRLTLVDLDDVCVTNTNRQLHALGSAVGRPKIEVMAERIADINPVCAVALEPRFFTERTADALLDNDFDCVVDAFDTARNKALLVARCHAIGRPVVVVGGAGGRQDPAMVRCGDLAATERDGLLRQVRQRLRKEHGFEGEGPWGVPAVYSRERAVFPQPDGSVCPASNTKESLRIDCNAGMGTASFVTGTYGFIAAAAAVQILLTP